MRRRKSHFLENAVIAVAAVLAMIVAYYGAECWLEARRQKPRRETAILTEPIRPERASLAVAAPREAKGASKSFVGVNSIPPMALTRVGHAAIRTKAPPAPKAKRD